MDEVLLSSTSRSTPSTVGHERFIYLLGLHTDRRSDEIVGLGT